MKKLLIAVSVLSLAACSWLQKPVFEENFNDLAQFQNNWNTKKNKAPGNIIYTADAGLEATGCVKITSKRPTYLSAKYMVTGLEAGKLYRATAMAKCKNVANGSGAALFVSKDLNNQIWSAADGLYDTKEWQEVAVTFVADENGEAMICCGLGAPWDGNATIGTAWFDDVKIFEASRKDAYSAESEHQVVVEEEPVVEEVATEEAAQ
ncbi:MAG: hypothetical protein E7131_00855 [Rikenellaceae bacterium]|nr:hypothetical protein [Rikenellaceae bacterium]